MAGIEAQPLSPMPALPPLEELLARFGTGDSASAKKLRLLVQLMNGRRSEDAETQARSERRQQLRRRIARLQREHRRLARRSRRLAEALGACYCWGEDPRCRRCRGRGAPGAMAPNPEAFAALIMPALAAAGLIVENETAAGAPAAQIATAAPAAAADPSRGD